MSAPAATGLSPLGKAFFGSLTAGTFALGCWQTQRFFEKQELEARRQHDLSLAPVPFHKDLAQSMQRQVVEGTYRHDKEILVGPRGPPPGAIASSGPLSGKSEGGMSSSPQGFYVITPLVSADSNETVLINRGWIPRQFVASSQTWTRPSGQVQVIGIPAKAEKPRIISPVHDFSKRPLQLFWMDQEALEQVSGVKEPFMLTQVKDDNGTSTYPAQPPLETVGEYKTTPMIHAGYAFTWFGLAGAGVVMTRKLITRGR